MARQKCPRAGVKVTEAATGRTGVTTALPVGGGRKQTCMPGPGGGMVYVKWDDGSTHGVLKQELASGKRASADSSERRIQAGYAQQRARIRDDERGDRWARGLDGTPEQHDVVVPSHLYASKNLAVESRKLAAHGNCEKSLHLLLGADRQAFAATQNSTQGTGKVPNAKVFAAQKDVQTATRAFITKCLRSKPFTSAESLEGFGVRTSPDRFDSYEGLRRLPDGRIVPVRWFTYESATALYDVGIIDGVNLPDGSNRIIFKKNNQPSGEEAHHRAIAAHFKLNLENATSLRGIGDPKDPQSFEADSLGSIGAVMSSRRAPDVNRALAITKGARISYMDWGGPTKYGKVKYAGGDLLVVQRDGGGVDTIRYDEVISVVPGASLRGVDDGLPLDDFEAVDLMFQWHGGQGSGFYSVASLMHGGHEVPRVSFERALSEAESNARNPRIDAKGHEENELIAEWLEFKLERWGPQVSGIGALALTYRQPDTE